MSRNCFDLKLKEYYHGRNKSEIVTNACFKWTCTDEVLFSSNISYIALYLFSEPSFWDGNAGAGHTQWIHHAAAGC